MTMRTVHGAQWLCSVEVCAVQCHASVHVVIDVRIVLCGPLIHNSTFLAFNFCTQFSLLSCCNSSSNFYMWPFFHMFCTVFPRHLRYSIYRKKATSKSYRHRLRSHRSMLSLAQERELDSKRGGDSFVDTNLDTNLERKKDSVGRFVKFSVQVRARSRRCETMFRKWREKRQRERRQRSETMWTRVASLEGLLPKDMERHVQMNRSKLAGDATLRTEIVSCAGDLV